MQEHPGRFKQQQHPLPIIFAIIFFVFALIDILAVGFHVKWLQIIAKPLIIPVLILHLQYSFSGATGKWLVYAALIFSTFGDIFLLFDFLKPDFFLFGVGAFLLAHVFYIIYFLKIKSTNRSIYSHQPWLLLLVAVYTFGLLLLLYPGLGKLKVPVIIYAIVISVMLLSSLHIFYKVQKPANKYYLFGAGLFVLSDSMLAIDKFYYQFPLAGLLIMLTYCAAQFLIVQGVVHHKLQVPSKE